MLIIFASAYIISSIFISVFDASANTILQCYLIDLDIARQSNLDPTHVPPTLAKFLLTQQQLNDDNYEMVGTNKVH